MNTNLPLRRDITLREFFGAVLDPVHERNLRALLADYACDLIPPHVTYEDLSRHDFGMLCPDDVMRKLRGLYKLVIKRASIFRRHFEKKFFDKCANGRNVRLGRLVAAKFANVSHNWLEYPKTQLTHEDVKAAVNAIGLRPLYQGLRIFDFEPPREQASAGLFVEDGKLYTGEKSKVWELARSKACRVKRECSGDRRLTFANVADMRVASVLAREICLRYKWILMPTWRLDGGPNKLRMLLIGCADVYVLEMWFWEPLHATMIKHRNFGYQPKEVCAYFESLELPRNWGMLSGDFKSYDERQQPEHLFAVYKAATEISGMPEWLGVLLYLFNTFAPALVLDSRNIPVVRWRQGQAASGIGGFAFANTLGCLTVNYVVSMRLYGKFLPGTYMGDDHVQPIMINGKLLWIATMWNVCGMEIDAVDSPVSPREAVYCRRFFKKGSGKSQCIVMSRARNVLFPEDGDPHAFHRLRRAIMYRAQSAEIMLGPLHKALLNAWSRLAPVRHCLFLEYPDDSELSRAYNAIIDGYDGERLAAESIFKLSWRFSWDD